jgi:hypothetical protein
MLLQQSQPSATVARALAVVETKGEQQVRHPFKKASTHPHKQLAVQAGSRLLFQALAADLPTSVN